MSSGQKLVGEDMGACPFCGKSIAVDIHEMAVFHELPMCSTFEQQDALQFITAVRRAREAQG